MSKGMYMNIIYIPLQYYYGLQSYYGRAARSSIILPRDPYSKNDVILLNIGDVLILPKQGVYTIIYKPYFKNYNTSSFFIEVPVSIKVVCKDCIKCKYRFKCLREGS